jgi:aryl-alcohol dehydrogenase-like predicted oxidoreductase
MQRRRLGTTDLQVSPLGFGCAALGSRTARRVAESAVSQACDLGINFFDTAPFYGQGESERIVGRALASHRDEVVIATKIGLYPSAALRLAARVKPLVRAALTAMPGVGRRLVQRSVQGFMRSSHQVAFDARSVAVSVESSLRRLRTDRIDLLLLHVTPSPAEVPAVLNELRSLQQQGKIRHFGASSHSDADTQMWLGPAGNGISAVQVFLNVFEIPALEACLPLAEQRGVAVVAREPFARGRLIPPDSSATKKLGFMGLDYDPRFEDLARQLGRTVPQLALQFLLQTPGIASVLAGMSTPKHLQDNARALGLPALSQTDMAAIRAVALRVPAALAS